MHDNPSPLAYLLVGAIATGAAAATAAWVARREREAVKVDPDAAAALERIHLRLVKGDRS